MQSGEPLGGCLAPLTALLPSCRSRWLKLPPLLSSSSVALRILAGEAIALVFELAQDMEVRWDAGGVGGSSRAGGQQSGRSCWRQCPARALAELALPRGDAPGRCHQQVPGQRAGPSDPPGLSW